MNEYQIQLLGTIYLSKDSVKIDRLRSQKALAILGYLASMRQLVSRSHLVALFWPDLPESTGRKNLNWVLHVLQKNMPGIIEKNYHELQYLGGDAYHLDIEAFQRFVSNKNLISLKNAFSLYRSEFLSGLEINASPEFDIWLTSEQNKWHHQYIELIHQIVDLNWEQGDYHDAIQFGQKLVTIEPLDEIGHVKLMRLYHESGLRSAALQQYESCVTILQEEFQLPPSPATQTLYEQIKSSHLPIISQKTKEKQVLFSTAQHNIPNLLNPFVGREKELAYLTEKLTDGNCRLLTVIGPGGIGKSILTVQFAHQLLHQLPAYFSDGLYFIKLSEINSDYELVTAITTAINLPLTPNQDLNLSLNDQLCIALSDKRILLILDNFEHIYQYAHILTTILEKTRSVKILVSSQILLNISGEWRFILAGLTLPQTAEIAALNRSDSARLFLYKARQLISFFQYTEENSAAIFKICHLLEGHPLGIEFAATWLNLMDCNQIAQEIEKSAAFFQTSQLPFRDRHKNLTVVVQYSWDLLNPQEKAALFHLARFPGGFTSSTALEIGDVPLSTLSHLINKSWLSISHIPGRYQMHQLLRHFVNHYTPEPIANEQMTEEKMALYFARFLNHRLNSLRTGQQQATLNEITHELANLRHAWQWLLTQPDKKLTADLISSSYATLFHYYDMRSLFKEGVDLFQKMKESLAQTDSNQTLLAELTARLGWLHFYLGQINIAKQLLEASVSQLEQLKAEPLLPFSLNYLAAVYYHQGEYTKGAALCQRAVAICQQQNNLYDLGIATNILCQNEFRQGHYTQAKEYGEQSLRIKMQIGDYWGEAFCYFNLGSIAYRTQQFNDAELLFQQSLMIRQEIGDKRGIAMCVTYLGLTNESLGNLQIAAQMYRKSYLISEEIGDSWGVIDSLRANGRLSYLQGSYTKAAAIFQQALSLTLPTQIVGKILDLIWEISLLLAHLGEEETIHCLAFILHHPETPTETKQKAEQRWQEYAIYLPQTEQDMILIENKSIPLENKINRIQQYLTRILA